MRLHRLRWRLGRRGLVLLKKGSRWLLTNQAVSDHRKVEQEFTSLREVEKCLAR